MLGKMLWETFGVGGPAAAITLIVVINFGVYVYSELIMSTGGEIRNIQKLKNFTIINIVLTAAFAIVNKIFGQIMGG